MKLSLIFYGLAIFAIISLSSCGTFNRDAYMSVTDDGQTVVIDEVAGEMTPTEFTHFKRIQDETASLAELEKQLQKAVKKNQLATADSLQDLIDRKKFPNRYNGMGARGGNIRQTNIATTKPVKLGVINNSRDDVRILNGPYAGVTINAGKEITKALPWPSGSFPLEYEVLPIGGSYSFKKQINVSIPEDRTKPISFY